MKYVKFQHKAGLKAILVFPDHVTHSTVRLAQPGYKAVSAGFWHYVEGTKLIATHGESESLGMKPEPEDGALIFATLQGLPTSFFLA
jgi:hypothetical protein